MRGSMPRNGCRAFTLKEEVVEFYRDTVFSRFQVFVAENDNHIAGMIALAPDNTVSALYVHATTGIRGSARRCSIMRRQKPAGRLNYGHSSPTAMRRHSISTRVLRKYRRTEGDNEEKLPDILYRWQPDSAEAKP